jgi:hypothetical protein
LHQGHNPSLLTLLIDEAYFTPGDLVIEPEFIIRGDVAFLQ